MKDPSAHLAYVVLDFANVTTYFVVKTIDLVFSVMMVVVVVMAGRDNLTSVVMTRMIIVIGIG